MKNRSELAFVAGSFFLCYLLIRTEKETSMLEIIYSDQFYVAINKPSGLMVHKSDIARDVKEFALQKLRDQIKQRFIPVIDSIGRLQEYCCSL